MLWKKIPKRTVMFPVGLRNILSLISCRLGNSSVFIKKFENRFRQHIGVQAAIAVSSGRCAMHLILKNLGLKKGDSIILSAYNFSGVPKALAHEGFRIIFIDADKDTCQIDIRQIERKIHSSTKAIIVTHLFGQPCDLAEIMTIARKYNLAVIEDSAHSVGSFYKGRHTGTIADAGFFSFTGSKTLNTSFGGMIVTNNTDLADKIRVQLLNYGLPKKRDLIKESFITYMYSWLTDRVFYTVLVYPVTLLLSMFNLDPLEIYKASKHKEIAENRMRFTEYQAAIGLRQMDSLDHLISKRKKIAARLFKNLHPSISIQKIPLDCNPNYFMVPIKAKDKLKVSRYLLFRGIDSNLNYATDCSYLLGNNNKMPVAKFLSDHILTINLPYNLKEKEVISISEVFNGIKDWIF